MVFNVIGGAPTPLNYRVLMSAAAPVAAGRANDIALVTAVAIGDVQLNCASEPTTRSDGTALQAGDVYVAVLAETETPFNAIKKNALYGLPGTAYQYDGSAWNEKDAYYCDGDTWAKFSPAWSGQLYYYGDEYEPFTGGWQTRGWRCTNSGISSVAPTLTRNADNMYANQSTNCGAGVLEVSNDIDLTDYSTLTITFSAAQNDSNPIYLYVGDRSGACADTSYASRTTLLTGWGEAVSHTVGTNTLNVDISGLTGSYDVYIFLWTSHGGVYQSVTVYSVLLT